MVSDNSDIKTGHDKELQEILEIGIYLGSGPRYLLYYYGQLAITNNAGLMHWPEGPKVVVAVINARECVRGLSQARKSYLMAKLRSLEGIVGRQNHQAIEEEGRLSLQRR